MDSILLRFRELTQNIVTIEEHNDIAQVNKRVYWGWWKKDSEPFPDPMLSEFKESLKSRKNVYIYFLDSGKGCYYKAPLFDIIYTPGEDATGLPEDRQHLCPEYYRKKQLPAWFLIGEIVPVENKDMVSFVISHNNRASKRIRSIPFEDIGSFLLDVDMLSHPVSIWFICEAESFDGIDGRSIRNISHGSYPTKGKYILHLSDLHFGEHHAYKNPHGIDNPTSKETLFQALIDDLSCVEENINDKIALVIISGDLTWRADPHEFSNAEQFITQLCQEFGLGSEHIIAVPGNHDIEWIDPKGHIDTNAELNYKNFFKTIYRTIPNEPFLRINRYDVNGSNLCVISLNSCRLESAENAGYGYIGSDQLKQVQDYFANNNDIDYSIAVMHHHVLPVNYVEDYDPQSKRISMLLDAESVMQCLIASGVNCILHGHQHQPYFTKITRVLPEYIKNGNRIYLQGELSIVGAGSIGVSQSKLNAIGRNSYNIITVEDKKLRVRTRIKSSSGVGFYSDDIVEL